MLELKNDAAIMRFVAKNYKRIKKECALAQQKSRIQSGENRNLRGVNQRTQTIEKKQLSLACQRRKMAHSFPGRVVTEIGCSHEKAKRAKKTIELLRQKKILRDVVLNIMRGQISLREALYGRGCVYFLSWRGLIKIGCTKLTAEERAKQIARNLSDNECGAELLGCIQTPDPYFLEKKLHEKYATKRIMGEWFCLSDADIAAVFSAFES